MQVAEKYAHAAPSEEVAAQLTAEQQFAEKLNSEERVLRGIYWRGQLAGVVGPRQFNDPREDNADWTGAEDEADDIDGYEEYVARGFGGRGRVVLIERPHYPSWASPSDFVADVSPESNDLTVPDSAAQNLEGAFNWALWDLTHDSSNREYSTTDSLTLTADEEDLSSDLEDAHVEMLEAAIARVDYNRDAHAQREARHARHEAQVGRAAAIVGPAATRLFNIGAPSEATEPVAEETAPVAETDAESADAEDAEETPADAESADAEDAEETPAEATEPVAEETAPVAETDATAAQS